MRLHAVSLSLILLFSLTCFAQDGATTKVDDYIRAEMQAQQIPGVSLAVIRNGEIVWARGYGLANIEHQVPVKPETIFQSGSMGKQFTATAVMMLVEEGKLSLDDKITKYFPDGPESWRNITVRHLLTHTSGMTDYPDDFDLRRDYTEDELVQRIKPIPLAFQPGDKWSYSNLAYVMLGVLIHKVSGKFYGDFLQERVFKPSGMSTARVISEADIIPNRAAGYRLVNGQLKNQDWVSPTLNTTADGALYLTVYDMAKWDAALYTEKLLKRSSLEQMWTPVKLNNGKTHPYGFGWALGDVRGHRVVEHGGAWQGFKSQISRYIDDKLTVVVFANQARANPAKLAHGVAAIFNSELAPPAAPSAAVEFAHAQIPAKEPTATITGRITIKEKGVQGIVVGLRTEEQGYRPQQATVYRGVTDAEGNYRITNVPAGTYRVIPVAPVFVLPQEEGSKTLIVDKGETIEHVDFPLVRGGVITGKVTDGDGRAVIEEEVWAMPLPATDRGFYRPWNARTDDRGVYRIFGIPPGSYKVVAGQGEENAYPGRSQNYYKRTYYPATIDPKQATAIDVSEGSEAKDIDITLSRALTTYTASGRIVDEDARPLANLTYGITHFINANSTSSWSNGAATNARGEFKIEGLLPGQYSIALRPSQTSDWRADTVRFEVVDQDVKDLIVKAKKGASVSGVVVLEGTDDKAVRDQLSRSGLSASVAGDSNDRPWSNWATLGPELSFRIGSLQPGTVMFYFPNATRFRIVRVEQNGVVQPQGIQIKDGEQLTGIRVIVNYGNASIRGVIEIVDGTLPENARFYVQLRKPGDDPSRVYASDPSPQVDARGQFIIDGLMPGTYEVSVGLYMPGARLVEKRQEVVVTAGTATNVNIKLELKSTVRP